MKMQMMWTLGVLAGASGILWAMAMGQREWGMVALFTAIMIVLVTAASRWRQD